MHSLARHHRLNRRAFLHDGSAGVASIGLSHLLAADGLLADTNQRHPLERRAGHFIPRAKRLLVIFCNGGVSQVDSWDYKPELEKRHDQPHPETGKLIAFQSTAGNLKNNR